MMTSGGLQVQEFTNIKTTEYRNHQQILQVIENLK